MGHACRTLALLLRQEHRGPVRKDMATGAARCVTAAMNMTAYFGQGAQLMSELADAAGLCSAFPVPLFAFSSGALLFARGFLSSRSSAVRVAVSAVAAAAAD